MSLRICWPVISMTSKPQFGGERVKVSDVFDLQMGKTPSRKNLEYWNNGDHEWVSIKDLGSYSKYVGTTKETISELGRKESGIKPVPKDTLIMSFKLSLGKTAITTKETYTNEAIMAFLDRGEYSLDLEYMWHQFRTKNWEMGTNIAVMGKTLNKKTLGASTICVPSILQQQKIAMRLNFVQNLIDKALGEVKLLENLVKSRFVEMFGSIVDNPKCWQTLPLSIAAPVDYKAFPEEDRVWQLNLDAVESMSGSVLSKTYAEAAELKGSIGGFDSSQVLYSKLRPYLNKVVVPDSSGVCTTELLPLSPLENVVNKVYLATALRSSEFVTFASNHSNGAKMPRTNMKAFRSFELPIPPFKLQQQFADFVAQVDKSGFA